MQRDTLKALIDKALASNKPCNKLATSPQKDVQQAPLFEGQKTAPCCTGFPTFSSLPEHGVTESADTATKSQLDDDAEIQAGRAVYENFCPGYWQRCGQCPEFDPMRTLFCRRYNRTHDAGIPGAEIDDTGEARLIPQDDKSDGAPTAKALRCIDCPMWQDAGSAYWVGRCQRTGHKVGFRSRCSLGVPEVERSKRGGYTAIDSRMGHRTNAKAKNDH